MDYSAADEIAQVFRDEAGPIIAQHFHADTYVIYSVTSTPDGYGGVTDTEAQVESGRCVLERRNSTGGVRIAEQVVIAESDYIAELSSPTSVLTTNHIIAINGRRFDVQDVQREGNAGMFTYAALKEEGPR